MVRSCDKNFFPLATGNFSHTKEKPVRNITEDIVAADAALSASERRVKETAATLRQYKREHDKLRAELSQLIEELRTGVSRYPLLEQIAPAGQETPSTQTAPQAPSWRDIPIDTVFSTNLELRIRHFGIETLGGLADGLEPVPITEATFLSPDQRIQASDELLDFRLHEHWTGEDGFPARLCGFTAGDTADPAPPPSSSTTSYAWTDEDLDREVLAACRCAGSSGEGGYWQLLRTYGCDDLKILSVLRASWPKSPRFDDGARTIRGGAIPALWMGAITSKVQAPALAGMVLADRIRRVLGIPLAPDPEVLAGKVRRVLDIPRVPEPEPAQQPAVNPKPKRRKRVAH